MTTFRTMPASDPRVLEYAAPVFATLLVVALLETKLLVVAILKALFALMDVEMLPGTTTTELVVTGFATDCVDEGRMTGVKAAGVGIDCFVEDG
jgi:hypothetical protein